MATRGRFIAPKEGRSKRARWAFTASAVVLGIYLLLDSRNETGLLRDGEISVGVGALAFAALSMLLRVRHPTGLAGLASRIGMAALFALGAGAAILVASSVDGEWATAFWLEVGVALLLIAALDLLFEAMLNRAREEERVERRRSDELATSMGLASDLSAWAYYWMRDALDATPPERYSTEPKRVLLLLDYVRKARDLPPHLDSEAQDMLRKYTRRDLEIMRLAAETAAKHELTDDEFFYLINAAAAWSDPDGPVYRKEIATALDLWIGNAAEHIIRSRPSIWKRVVGEGEPDSLEANRDIERFYMERFPKRFTEMEPILDQANGDG